MALLTRQNRRMDTIGLSKLKTQTIMNSKHQSEILCLWNEPTECSSVQCLSPDTFRICWANCWHGLLTGGRRWGHPYLNVKKSTSYPLLRMKHVVPATDSYRLLIAVLPNIQSHNFLFIGKGSDVIMQDLIFLLVFVFGKRRSVLLTYLLHGVKAFLRS